MHRFCHTKKYTKNNFVFTTMSVIKNLFKRN